MDESDVIGGLELPGDRVIADPSMVFDHSTVYEASSEDVWPWIVQLGKWRGGWYMPARLEPWIVWSRRRRAATVVEDRWQHLSVGDRVPDYGGRKEEFEVIVVDRPHALVYSSKRRSASFTWALVLTPLELGRTRLHTRFRGSIAGTGRRRAVLVMLGSFLDWATITVMFAGLRERVEKATGQARGGAGGRKP